MIERRLKPFSLGEHLVKVPIVGGAMSIAVAGDELTAGISNLGGAGTLGGVGRAFLPENKGLAPTFREADPIALQKIIDITREKSPDGVIGVNVLMAARWHKAMIRAAVESGGKGKRSKIDYLVIGAGFSDEVPEWVADHPEVALVIMASSDIGAAMMARAWWKDGEGRLPDAIVLEDPKYAGGHLGANRDKINRRSLRLEYSVRGLRERLDGYRWPISIIAAGGVWGKEDMDRILALGADAVQMATRFVATKECDASEAFKQIHLMANGVNEESVEKKEGDIVLVDSPVGMPGRAIYNQFLRDLDEGKIHDRCKVNCLTKCLCRESKGASSFCIIDHLVKAYEGDEKEGLFFSGSNAYRSKGQGIVPVKQIFDELCGIAV